MLLQRFAPLLSDKKEQTNREIERYQTNESNPIEERERRIDQLSWMGDTDRHKETSDDSLETKREASIDQQMK